MLTFVLTNAIINQNIKLRRDVMSKQVANVQLMQKMNRLKVLEFIRKNSYVSRPFVSKETGLSLASITNIVTYLLEVGLISECGTEKVGRVGRKSTLLCFNAKKFSLICINLTEKHIIATFTDLAGKPIEKIRVETVGLSHCAITEEIRKIVQNIRKKYAKSAILGIGIAISGLVLEDSRFILSSHLKWRSFDIKKALEQDLNIPIFVNNISFIKAVWYFSKNPIESFDNPLYIDMEKGIGAVQYQNGSIVRNTLGEIGHTTVDKDGEPCFCGNKGCLEAMCSPNRIISLYEKYSEKKIDSISEIDKLYKKEDPYAYRAISECGKYLGIGLANLVNLFNPSTMVINLGDFEGCPSLLIEAECELKKRAYSALTQKLSIKHINETEEDIIYGIAYDLCNKLFDISFPYNIVE